MTETTETSLSEHLGGPLKIWRDALQLVRTRDRLDPEERARWVELYEHEIARVRGEGPTREDCGKIRARVEAWSILRRPIRQDSPPEDDGFALYVTTQARRAESRRGGDRVPAAEIENAGRVGRVAFERWYWPVEDQLSKLAIVVAKLERFGTADDASQIEKLRERGDTIARWLRYQQTSGTVPWLPDYAGHLRPIDQWWRETIDHKRYRDVGAWWEAQR